MLSLSKHGIPFFSNLLMFIAVVCMAIFPGCIGKRATPDEVLKNYELLKADFDEDAPGEFIEKLKIFRDRYAKFHISTTASQEISRLQALVKGRFHFARELAREGARLA